VLVHGEVGAAGPEARITVLDVGAGSAILVESGGSRILLGGGPAGGGTLRALDATLPPWDRSLNLVVVANGSAENVGGLQEVLAHYHVDGFVNAAPEPTAPTALRTFLRAAAAAKLRNVPAGDLTVNAGDATMRIQAAGQDSSGKAASSATVELEVGARRLVLAGEAGDDPAADLRIFGVRDRPVPAIPARVELLQAGPVSSAEGDLAAVPEGLRSAPVYRTTENGTVTITTDGRSIAVYVQRGPMLGLFAGRRQDGLDRP
jgi:beta-lactamase superfamily II metal-dependent hydrolase